MKSVLLPADALLDLSQALEQAQAALERRAIAEAEGFYRAALALAPDHAGAWNGLAQTLHLRGATEEAQAARTRSAESAVTAAIKTAAMLLDTPMEARAPAVLTQAVQAHPSVLAGPLALCELLRKLGDLSGAVEAAKQALTIDPGNERALQLVAALNGRRISATSDLGVPVPVLVKDDFLPAELHEAMLKSALLHRSALQPSTTENKDNPDWRRSMVDQLPDFAPRVLSLICQIAEPMIERLGVESFEMTSRDMQFTVHNEGDYYRVHRDWGPHSTTHRRLTFVYYLHRQPRGFEGGALRLFDTSNKGGYFVEFYSRVLPRDNRLVLFPSDFWHEVETVKCPSRLYEDSRFTLNGWLGVGKAQNA